MCVGNLCVFGAGGGMEELLAFQVKEFRPT